jgi:hypothetical protein
MAKQSSYTTEGVVTVELPREVVRILGKNRAAATAALREIVLIDLRRRGVISGGYAAGELGVTKAEILDVLARHEVPYLDLTEDELRAGRKAIWDHRKAAGR